MVFNLVRNENVKIYRRLRSYIFMGIVLLAMVVYAIVLHNTQDKSSGNWKQALVTENEQMTKDTSGPHVPQSARDETAAKVKVNQYEIDHNIQPNQHTGWSFAASSSGMVALITIFVAVVAGDIVASEFSAGTIKLLLIRPVNRTKILLSKYLATLLYALLMVCGLLVVSLLVGGVLFGFTGMLQPFPRIDANNVIHQGTVVGHVFSTYGFSCIQLIMIVTISFMISTIFRSSSLAIALSILLMFLGTTVVQILSRFQWDKYILFANIDLSQYFNGTPIVQGMTLTFSIVMLLVYFIIFHAASWMLFTKRDVGA